MNFLTIDLEFKNYKEKNIDMRLEKCLECEFHKYHKHGQVLCNYKNHMISMATYLNDIKNEVSVIGCPKDKD